MSNGIPIRQSLKGFVGGYKDEKFNIPSSITYWMAGRLDNLLKDKYYKSIREEVLHFAEVILGNPNYENVSMYGPGLYYPGLKVIFEDGFEVGEGLYVVGDITGRFRGILQSFASGLISGGDIKDAH
jgi:uncharacterized FAD-dependent dehydrogenase